MQKRSLERGQTLPIVALCLIMICAFAALAIDAGYLEYKQRLQQSAADAAAIAGGWALLGGTSVTSGAQAASTKDGFTDDGGTTVTVSATSPPATGPNSGNTNAVEVNITAKYPAIFSAIWRSQNSVSTRAVSVIEGNPNGPCIWVMDKDFTNNNGTLTSPCGIMVNRNAHLGTVTAPSIAAGGKIDGSQPSGVVLTEGIPAFNDPCQTIPGCRALTASFPLGHTPGPGPYVTCSSVSPTSGSSIIGGCYPSLNGTFNLAPGLYIVQGDFSATLTCTTCSLGSSGVTIVVGGKVNLNGSSTVLNAPPNYQGVGTPAITSAGAPGVLIYQTSSSTNPENFSAQTLLGMIYAPGAHVNLDGGGSTLTTSYIVAADIVANKAVITVTNTSLGNPSQVPVLSE